MVLCFNAATSSTKFSALKEMHIVRRRVFVDNLGWRLPVTHAGLEIDQFDGKDCVYIICVDAKTDAHLCSARLLPTTKPHVLGDLFAHLCEEGAPCGADVWELSRYCVSPELPKHVAMPARYQVMGGIMEYALLMGIARLVCVIDTRWLSSFLTVGWDCRPLGPPRLDNGAYIGAFEMSITIATYQNYCSARNIKGPFLEIPTAVAA